MDAELKKKWVEALRSGDYRQGRDCLRLLCGSAPDRFCCIGVLCDLVNPEGWTDSNAMGMAHWTDVEGLVSAFTMPTDVAMKIGLCDRILLQSMNDSGSSFDEIADYIEENL